MCRSALIAFSTAWLITLAGCANIFYARTPTGTFEGRLIVQWVQPNQFIYLPDPDKPLRYRSASGQVIQPRGMYTDAGSIPRLFWSNPGLGPWDFAPGYIIHDWLFEQHHCKVGDWEHVTFEDSATLLAEAMKTQIESATGSQPQPTIVWAVYEAVRTDAARNIWDSGNCKPPPNEKVLEAASAARPVTIVVVDFR